MQTVASRQLLMKHLNKYRSTNQCALQTKQQYDNLCDLLAGVLAEAHREMDVHCAMKTLVFANNFYLLNNGHKDYVQNGISKLQIWHDFKFWERVIYDCIQDELEQQKC